ncbi:vitamin K-dependent protein S isoform X4 [Phascolarctos cinereus]|uniref:Vitamin K-dependent protein S n=1 Tax=Phascolarctos cinereus TaxID=38626 RepID=A0A6P5JAU5_PHACI|nr:vitamin K-dependent protein S isoform X4 [Phascolarctos cinereus]
MRILGGRCVAFILSLIFMIQISEAVNSLFPNNIPGSQPRSTSLVPFFHDGGKESISKAISVLSKQHASQILMRKRRANTFMEETKKGNLERECIEELCNKEEAREVFENEPETNYFYPLYLGCLGSFRVGSFVAARQSTSAYTDLRSCVNDVNECALSSKVCGTALCKNTPGDFECECPKGYRYNSMSMECEDVDECAENLCSQLCVNHPGGYSCYCDGKKGFRLSQDQKNCEPVPLCLPLNLEKNYELLYLAEQFVGIPVLYLRFRLPEITRFSAEFDFRTYDSEGVILYAESLDHSAWFLLALRDGRIEIQFKNEHGAKVTSGGKIINDGLWNIVSVEELENSISVKIAKEAVMNINSPSHLFKPTNGFLETKVYFAGLPRTMENGLMKLINPRLDGCIRGWNLMNQGASGVKEIIQEKQNKHCLVSVEKGSYYPGSGVAQFDIDYNNVLNAEGWQINVTLDIRPSTGTGVMLALVSGDTVPLALSLVDSSSSELQDVLVTIENTIVSRMEAKRLCTHENSKVELRVLRGLLELTNGFKGEETIYHEDLKTKLAVLDKAMMGKIATYLGGIKDVPVNATLVNVFYNGCMDVKINGKELDLDEAVFKQNDIRSHSCPTVSKNPNTF